MSFSYDISEDVGKIRFKIQDTTAATAKFQDEEIEYILEVEGTVNCAAAGCLEILAAKMAGEKESESIEGYSYKKTAGSLLAAALALRNQDHSAPWCGVMVNP